MSAPPRSIYRKIQVVLKESRRRKLASRKTLVDRISVAGHTDFTYYDTSVPGQSQLKDCDHPPIERIVMLCAELELIDADTGRLTTKGMRATDEKDFDRVLSQCVEKALKRLGASVDDLRDVASDLLSRDRLVDLPTWDTIYDRLDLDGGSAVRQKFRIYLGLLSASGGIQFTRKKLYLP